jgi:hypothetical protein
VRRPRRPSDLTPGSRSRRRRSTVPRRLRAGRDGFQEDPSGDLAIVVRDFEEKRIYSGVGVVDWFIAVVDFEIAVGNSR